MSVSGYCDESDESDKSNDGQTIIEWQSLKDTLLGHILQVHSTGSFATLGNVQDFQSPGISVDSQEPIRLPLSADDAQSLIRISHQSPFGKGTDTMIDLSVRKTWQIDANRVHFHNSKWQECLDRVTSTVAQELGVPGTPMSVHAEFYKMLLYEEGAMFKLHQDTEKVAGMFGTLVICLPSFHTGGDVELQHGNKNIRYNTSQGSAFGTQYIAWYADVCHEIHPVQSGYRWVLTYNLINTVDRSDLSAQFLQTRVSDLTQALNTWQTLPDFPGFLIYPLEHQYTNESLKISSLKGEDFQRARHITQSCAEHGTFQVLLANMEPSVKDFQCDEDESEKEKELYLTRIVDLEGSDMTIYPKLSINYNMLLGSKLHKHRDPDIQRGGGYMGNQHAEIDQFYKDSVLVIVPTPFFETFLLGFDPKPSAVETFMVKLRMKVQERKSGAKAKDHFLGSVATSAASLGDSHLFTEAVEKTTYSFDLESYENLGRIINFQDGVIRTDDIVTALTKNGELKQTISNIDSLRTGFVRDNPLREDLVEKNSVQTWLHVLTINSIKEIQTASSKDASCLADLMVKLEDSSSLKDLLLYQTVCSFASRFSTHVDFSIPCVVEILRRLQISTVSPQHLSGLLNQLVKPVVTNFSLQIYGDYVNQVPEHAATKMFNPMVSLYTHIDIPGSNLSSILLTKLHEQAIDLEQPQGQSILFKLLSDLLGVIDTKSEQAQDCIASLVMAYIMNFVGLEPKEPVDWLRLGELHECPTKEQICKQLNEFLQDANAQTCSLSMAKYYHVRHFFKYLQFNETAKNESCTFSKTSKHWQQTHRRWEIKLGQCVRRIEQLPPNKLKECLLDRYDELVSLECVKIQQN